MVSDWQEMGWNASTKLALMHQFVESRTLVEELDDYLQAQADEEQEESEFLDKQK